MLRIVFIPVILLGLLAGSLIWSGEGRFARADFAFVNRGDTITLDLNDMSYAQDLRIAYALWEGLYTPDPVTVQPILGTADSVQISEDHRVYTFHIRDTARWTNGDPVLADDFLFAWRRMLESPREYSYLHYYIKGARAYEEAFAKYAQADLQHKPAKPDFSTVGEERLDARVLRITLTDPVPFFAAVLSFPPFYPMHAASMLPFQQIDSVTGAVSYRAEFTRPPNLVTNGKYRLADWAFKRRLRLIASDYYWDREHTKSKVIDEIHAEDGLAAYRLYQQRDVDWLADVDPDIAATLLAEKDRPDLHIFTGFGTMYYEFNCEPKLPDGEINPLADVRVRQALAMSINKVPIIRDVTRLNQPLATTYIPVGAFPGYRSPSGLPYDVQKARQLLADAGYPGGRGLPPLSILYNTEGGIWADIATIIRRQWADNLGIHVDPRGEELSQYKNDLHNHRFTIARANWSGDYNDPSTFTDKYLSSSENNAADWISPAYDKLCADAALEPDPTKRFTLLSQAEDLLLTQAPIAPLYTTVGTYMYRDNVHGMYLNALATQMFQAIYVQRPQ